MTIHKLAPSITRNRTKITIDGIFSVILWYFMKMVNHSNSYKEFNNDLFSVRIFNRDVFSNYGLHMPDRLLIRIPFMRGKFGINRL
jgi:hypothetical protein